MSLRVILARLNGTPTDQDVLCGALAVSKTVGGHTVAFFSRPEPRSETVIIDEGISAADYDGVIADMEKEWKEFALNAYKNFEKWRADNNIPFIHDSECSESPSAEWQVSATLVSEAENIARLGRVADILVSTVSTARSENTGLEAALFDTGRPVLLVPSNGGADVTAGRVVIGWNGSVEASHAVAAAMPLLIRAQQVMAFTVPKGNLRLGAAEELVAYLKWHGVRASVLKPEAGGANSVSGALLGAVKKVKANLLVMGAYTHSRVRERFFGGVTKHVLNKAEIPILMAH